MISKRTVWNLALFLALSFSLGCQTLEPFQPQQSAGAATEQSTQFPVSKLISPKELEKYSQITLEMADKGQKVKYSGVALRTMLVNMIPELNLDTMPEWKKLARQELVIEALGNDGYPGLITALDVAMNKSGDRYILALQKDGQPLDTAPQLICSRDEAHTRWIRNVVSLRIVALPKK